MINKIAFLVCIILGFVFISCENNITNPGKSGPEIRFSLEKSNNSNPSIGLLNSMLKKGEINPAQLLKASGYDELKIICLDMTKFAGMQDFLQYWYTNSQIDMIDYNLWDSTKDVFDNYALLLKKYTGDAYDYMGDYSFSVKDSVAKGTVYLNPGLNDFIFALRTGGKTIGYLGETQAIISKDSVNNIKLSFSNQPIGNPPNNPSTPHPPDLQTGVFRTATLTWVCTDPDNDVLIYDVYMGTTLNNILPVALNLATAQYTPTLMQANTTYYWYIIAKDVNSNVAAGPLWQFTTGIQ